MMDISTTKFAFFDITKKMEILKKLVEIHLESPRPPLTFVLLLDSLSFRFFALLHMLTACFFKTEG
jgi:hypothetical protein